MILIVDDNREIAKPLQLLLKIAGHETEAVTSAPQALTYLRDHHPDVIVLDQEMPGMTGLELLSKLRRNPDTADTPVYFYSATDDPATRHTAESLGPTRWLPKSSTSIPRLLNELSTAHRSRAA
jgi:CheY-like chemotaxis protein